MTRSERASHDHGAAGRATTSRLALTLALSAAYLIVEVIGGLLSGSLALLADAGHMLSDVAALVLSLIAMRIAARPPSSTQTFGYRRAEILAALANGAALVAVAALIVREAIERFLDPPAVQAGLMLAIAAGGLVVNLAGVVVLHRDRAASLNLRGAWLHVATDALGSVQAIAAGAAIALLGWRWADPLASLLIAVLIGYSAWGLVRESVTILMEGVPADVDLAEVRALVESFPGVRSVHDLHVWTISSGFVALSAHIVAITGARGDLASELGRVIHEKTGIAHTTIQVVPEPPPQRIQ